VKRFFGGALTGLLLLGLIGLVTVWLGLIGVNADGNHSKIEARIMPVALHSSVARHSSRESNPLPVTEESLKMAATIYRANCSQCHGAPGGSPSLMGKSLYPPASQLGDGLNEYTEAQVFWMVKHGIRNTGMPAWGEVLTDDSIWQLASLLKNQQNLPPSVKGQLKPGANRSAE
jgi:cytochrome c553